MNFEYPPGSTPLDPNEIEGLIPSVTTQAELNEFEDATILKARLWALNRRNRRLKTDGILSIDGLKLLHQKMFDGVWQWAGIFRLTEKNIGVSPHQIQMEISKLCDDVKYQIEKQVFSADECAVRFHHRLTAIHPFANGNGRHARLAADILVQNLGQKSFTWGAQDLGASSNARNAYISALRKADAGDVRELGMFTRS